MRTKLTLKPVQKTTIKFRLRQELVIAGAAMSIFSFVMVFITYFGSNNTATKAESLTVTEPTTPNAYFNSGLGSYIDFGKVSNLANIKELSGKETMSITMWVKWNDFNAPGVGHPAELFCLSDSTGAADNGLFWVGHNTTNQHFEFAVKTKSATKQVSSNTVPAVGTWYHLGCIFDATDAKDIKIYVNGTLENTVASPSKMTDISAAAKLLMGRWANPLDNFRMFNGDMDEISIWNIALSQPQIDSIINSPESVMRSTYDRAGLIGYWDLFDMTANDRSPSHNNGKKGEGVTLPVELTSFTAASNDGEVELKWVTASETNNDYFLVERSADGESYEEIGRKDGAGFSNSMVTYKFSDINPAEGVNYYRLKQVDFDGAYEYSDIIAINPSMAENAVGTVTAGPNPFSDDINVNYSSPVEGLVDVTLYDMSGKAVKTMQVEASTGTNIFSFADNRDLPSGIYMLGVVSENKSTPLIKLIKSS